MDHKEPPTKRRGFACVFLYNISRGCLLGYDNFMHFGSVAAGDPQEVIALS